MGLAFGQNIGFMLVLFWMEGIAVWLAKIMV